MAPRTPGPCGVGVHLHAEPGACVDAWARASCATAHRDERRASQRGPRASARLPPRAPAKARANAAPSLLFLACGARLQPPAKRDPTNAAARPRPRRGTRRVKVGAADQLYLEVRFFKERKDQEASRQAREKGEPSEAKRDNDSRASEGSGMLGRATPCAAAHGADEACRRMGLSSGRATARQSRNCPGQCVFLRFLGRGRGKGSGAAVMGFGWIGNVCGAGRTGRSDSYPERRVLWREFGRHTCPTRRAARDASGETVARERGAAIGGSEA